MVKNPKKPFLKEEKKNGERFFWIVEYVTP